MELTTIEQRERQWQRAYRRRPTALETQDKTTETEARPSLATVYACTFPGCRFLAKFGCQPIKLELCPLAHTYPANYVSVHCKCPSCAWSRANEVKLTRTRTRMWYTINMNCRNKHCSDKDIEKDRKLGSNANGKL